jgi:hypothetical protein
MKQPDTKKLENKTDTRTTHLAMSRSEASGLVGCRTLGTAHIVADYLRSALPEDRTLLIQMERRRATRDHFYVDHIYPYFSDFHTADFHTADFRTAGCCNLAELDLVLLLGSLCDCLRAEHHAMVGCTHCH